MWLTLEGIDGAGKTTLANELCRHILGSVPYPRRDFEPTTDYVKAAKRRLQEVMWEIGDSRDLSPIFWLHMQAAWHTLAVEGRHMPETAISDGWYYKFFARLIAQGYQLSDLYGAFRLVPKPDLVVLLDVDPVEAWERKSYRPTELGMHANAGNLGMDSFVSYQRATYEALLKMSRQQDNWLIYEVPKGQSLEETTAGLSRYLLERIPNLQQVSNSGAHVHD